MHHTSAVETQWHLRDCHTISVKVPPTSIAFALRPLCASMELLWRCRCYCVAVVTLRQYHSAHIRLPSNCVCLFCACSKCGLLLCILCNPIASTDDASALRQQCLWLYCTYPAFCIFLGRCSVVERMRS